MCDACPKCKTEIFGQRPSLKYKFSLFQNNASHIKHLNIGDRDEYPGCCVS